MFTGIIQTLGQVASKNGPVLEIDAPYPASDDPWQLGESVAINGVCLTVVASEPNLRFDVSEETYAKTTHGQLTPGDQVNLERAMKASDRFGGHFVQGHVDAQGTIKEIEALEDSWLVTFAVQPDHARYLIPKGSIALDGISLTIVDPKDSTFQVAIIPHTWENTNLHTKKEGEAINVEFDTLTKTVEALLANRS